MASVSAECSSPSRAHWMATEGCSLFTDVTVAIARQLGRRPLRNDDRAVENLANYVATDEYFMLSLALTGGLVRSSMAAAAQPSTIFQGRTPLEALESRRPELERYTDLAQFGDGVPGLLRNSLDFAFGATMRAADAAIGHGSLSEVDPVSTYQSLIAMRSAMMDPGLVPDVLEPLAAAGFGIEGNRFLSGVGSSASFKFEVSDDLQAEGRGVRWTNEAEPSPYLDPELRKSLAATMRDAGRSSFIYRAGGPADVTSSGCPVRRAPDRKDKAAMSAIGVTNFLMVLAIDQVELAFARTAAGKSAVSDVKNLA